MAKVLITRLGKIFKVGMQAMRQQNYAKGRQQGQPELLMLHCKGEL